MTPFGWPQIVLYCTTKDSNGDEIIKSYGCVHIPIAPGMHKKTIRMFAPVEHNSLLEFFGIMKEGKGLYID
jgi:B9 domain-containing protein 1